MPQAGHQRFHLLFYQWKRKYAGVTVSRLKDQPARQQRPVGEGVPPLRADAAGAGHRLLRHGRHLWPRGPQPGHLAPHLLAIVAGPGGPPCRDGRRGPGHRLFLPQPGQTHGPPPAAPPAAGAAGAGAGGG